MDKRFTHLDTAVPKDGWVILGPGGGGCVHLLAVNPHQPNNLVVSGDMTAGYITQDGGQTWRQFNLKSRQYAYAFDPICPDTIYAGSSGLFRSEDRGHTWQLIYPDPSAVTGETRLGDEANHTFLSRDNWPGKTIHAILIDPHNRDRLFIVLKKEGARQPDDDFYHRPKNGLLVYTSEDYGRSWQPRAELTDGEIHLLAFAPGAQSANPDLFAFTERSMWHLPAQGAPACLTLPESVLWLRHASCGIDASTGEHLFYISAVGRGAGGGGESCIWRTAEPRVGWQRAAGGLEPAPGLAPPMFSQVSACDREARCAYLIAESFPEMDASGETVHYHGILKTIDGGESWTWVVRMDDAHDPPNRTGGWAERDYGAQWGDLVGEDQISPKGRFAWDVVASPMDPQVCYTMDFSTVYQTCNGGLTWEQLVTHLHPDGSVSSRGIDINGIYGLFFDPVDAQHIALGMSDAGVFHSWNRGCTWQHAVEGVPRAWINSCYWIEFDPQVPGRAWSAWSAMHDLPRIKMFQDDLLAKHRGGICKTVNSLRTWQPVHHGLPEISRCTHLLLDPDSPPGNRTIYAAMLEHGVYKSVDDGLTWTQHNHGLDARSPFAWRFVRHPDGALYLVVLKNWIKGREHPGAIYRSVDGGRNWGPVRLPSGIDSPNDLTCDPAGRLYLACWPRSVEGVNQGGGAYLSEDGGRTWSCIFDPAVHVFSVSFNPQRLSDLYLATFHAAVHRSQDGGQTWRRLPGFNFQWCHRATPDPHLPGMLYLGTFGSSLWYGPEEGVPNAVEDIV
jgi:photosystem II stability/assembly factor-like uncharacterized protein